MELRLAVDTAENIFTVLALIIAFISALAGSLSLLRLKKNEQAGKGQITVSELESIRPKGTATTEPFEIVALANYYNQALSRANISFWFSLSFASIGFGVIIFAFLSHSSSDIAGTAIKVLSGTVIDAVAALFFILCAVYKRAEIHGRVL